MLRFSTVIAVSLFASTAVQAADVSPTVFQRDGQSYEYIAELHGNDVHINGKVLDNGEEFALEVSPTGRVTGEFGGDPVRYSITKETRDRLVAKLRVEGGIDLAELSVR